MGILDEMLLIIVDNPIFDRVCYYYFKYFVFLTQNIINMSTLRFNAIKQSLKRKPITIEEKERRSSLFGKNVFNDTAMKQSLTKDAYKSVVNAIQKGSKIDRAIADQIASSMKDWAINKGVTHYTHWFQPLTGATAEKHDAFFETIGDDSAILEVGN